MKEKILYISYTGLTEPLGQSQILNYLSGLSDNYTIHILSTEKKNTYETEREDIEMICQQHHIHWHPIIYRKNPPIFSTLMDIMHLKRTARKLHNVHQFKLVHCRSYIASLIGLHLKRKFALPFLFDMRGFWADERVDAGLWNKRNPIYASIYSFFKKKEKQFLTESDHVVSLTETGKREIYSWNLENQSPISVIPCCANFELFDYKKLSKEAILQTNEKFGLTSNDFIISYLGSIGTWYMLEEMLLFFKTLSTTIKNAKFLFITKESPDFILNKAQTLDIEKDKIIIQSAKRNEVPLLLGISNWALFFIKDYYSKKASSPTKQAEIMGMGLPLICNTGIGDVDRIVAQTQSGVQISHFTKSDFEQAIESIKSFMVNKKEIRQNGIHYFDLEEGIKNYKRIYKTLIK